MRALVVVFVQVHTILFIDIGVACFIAPSSDSKFNIFLLPMFPFSMVSEIVNIRSLTFFPRKFILLLVFSSKGNNVQACLLSIFYMN